MMEAFTGRVPANEGRGWDGMDYAAMLEALNGGNVNTALRPLIVIANRPAYRRFGNPVTAFRAMNYLYVALAAFAICLLFDRYSRDAVAKVLLALNLFVSIALVKYSAFYPVQIDLGAHAVILMALWAIVSGRRVATGVTTTAAVLAREFGIATVAFGVTRDLRQRVPLPLIAKTYTPAVLAFFGWRFLVTATWSFGGTSEPLGFYRLTSNLAYFADPVFAGFFMYFALTIFGGASLLVLARADVAVRAFWREPEWAVYAGLVLAAAAMGDADLWRYLAYLLPAIVVLFAICARELHQRRWRVAVAALVCVATAVTQRPLQTMDVTAYFRDWFPYYISKATPLPLVEEVPALWPVWGWRFLIAAGLLWLLAAASSYSRVPNSELRPHAHRA